MKDFLHPIRRLLAHPISVVANQLLTLLRNRVDLHLTRDEFRFCQLSFSQFGEDLAIIRWLDERRVPTIYVDVGCFHPIHYSNTLLLHKRGWRGINVDMFPEKIAAFEKHRPEDYNIVAALSSSRRNMEILEYEGIGRLTDRLNMQISTHPHTSPPVRRRRVTTRTLNEIIAETPWSGQRIGYLNIDCEGHDLEVLKGIDLRIYQPSVITIEAFEPEVDKTVGYLAGAGYVHRDRLHYTSLFVRGSDL
jgi:FkbM family methyltransferase